MTPLFVIVAGVVVACAVWWFATGDARRARKLRLAAPSLGLTYFANEQDLESARATELVAKDGGVRFKQMVPTGSSALCYRSHRHDIVNHLAGEHSGERISAYDIHVSVGVSKHRWIKKTTVVCVDSTHQRFPEFHVFPARFEGAVPESRKITLVDHPRFSELFQIGCSDPPAVARIFRPAVITFFEQRPDLTVLVEAELLVFLRDGNRVSPDKLSAFIGEAVTLYKLLAATDAAQPPNI